MAMRPTRPSGAPIPMPAFWLVERESEYSWKRLEAVPEGALDGSGCVVELLAFDAEEGPVDVLDRICTCESKADRKCYSAHLCVRVRSING